MTLLNYIKSIPMLLIAALTLVVAQPSYADGDCGSGVITSVGIDLPFDPGYPDRESNLTLKFLLDGTTDPVFVTSDGFYTMHNDTVQQVESIARSAMLTNAPVHLYTDDNNCHIITYHGQKWIKELSGIMISQR